MTSLTCMLMLIGIAAWLMQPQTQSPLVMSETKDERVHTGVDSVRMAWEGLAGMPAARPVDTRAPVPARAAINREWTIAMVLPRPEQNDERAFKQYLLRHHPNLRFVPVSFSGRAADSAALVAQIRAIRPDLIYAWGTPTTLAIAGRFDGAPTDGYIRDIPIVFAEVTDPVGAGLLPSLAAPRRNVTGVPHIAPLTTQLALLNAYRPFQKLGFIDNPLEPNSGLLLAQLVHTSKAPVAGKGFTVLSEQLQPDAQGNIDAAQIEAAVHRLKTQGAQVLYVGASTLLAYTYRDLLTETALKQALPTFCTTESILRQADCLFGIFSNGGNIGQYAAFKADRILSGTALPQEIPADPLQRFSIVINLPVAKRLSLYPPLALLPVAEVVTGHASVPAKESEWAGSIAR